MFVNRIYYVSVKIHNSFHKFSGAPHFAMSAENQAAAKQTFDLAWFLKKPERAKSYKKIRTIGNGDSKRLILLGFKVFKQFLKIKFM